MSDERVKIVPGAPLPDLIVVPTTEDLARYAGASRDFSRIHYDQDFAKKRGLPDVIVHGLLKAAYLGRMIESWLIGWEYSVQEFGTQYRRTDLPGEVLTCRGQVESVDGAYVELKLWTENAESQVTTRGRALIKFEGRRLSSSSDNSTRRDHLEGRD